MLTAKDLITGNEYQFSIYPSAVVQSFDKAAFSGLVSYDIASSIDPGCATRHITAYPFLPEGSVKDPSKIQWLIFKRGNQTFVYASDWINFATASEVTSNQISVSLIGVPQSQWRDLRTLLEKEGYKVAGITAV